MKHALLDLHSNRPTVPDPERPARIVATLVLKPCAQGIAPWLAVAVLCEDRVVRIKVTR